MSQPLPTLLSHALVAFTIELDNEFERRLAESGGGARVTSVVMWSNFLRHVGEGITVGEVAVDAGMPKARMASTIGGMERWRYVSVGEPARREGYGSASGLRPEMPIRPTDAGRRAAQIWPALIGETEGRWADRFGDGDVEALRASLTVVVGTTHWLPEFLPILSSSEGMAARIEPSAAMVRPTDHLLSLLARALLAYTLDFERRSEVSLALLANVIRVLAGSDELLVRDLPAAAGVSKEAVAMAMTHLLRAELVSVSGTGAATRRARLTDRARTAWQASHGLHDEVERGLGEEAGRLRAALGGILSQRDALVAGLMPPDTGWRASKPYRAWTDVVLADPSRLPHHPMVLHRGGWPDGS